MRTLELIIILVVPLALLLLRAKRRRPRTRRQTPLPREERRPAPLAHKRLPGERGARAEAASGEREGTLHHAKVEYVIDGDTVIVSRGWQEVRVRLDSIDCPEDGQDWGDTAKFGLIKLIGGRSVRLEEHGVDIYGRTLATVYVQRGAYAEWINVNERMVTLGHAWVMRRFYGHLPRDRQNKLNRLERWARSKKVGLWKTPDPIPPWKWRGKGCG